MAIISQTPLFSWKKVESSPEILRLSRVLRELPDEPIIAALVAQRKGKRNDYPVEAAIRAWAFKLVVSGKLPQKKNCAKINPAHPHIHTLWRFGCSLPKPYPPGVRIERNAGGWKVEKRVINGKKRVDNKKLIQLQ